MTTRRDTADPLDLAAAPSDEGREGRSAMRASAVTIMLPVATAAAFLMFWETAVRIFNVSPVVLPGPSEIYEKCMTILPLLFSNAVRTCSEALLGLVLASALGIGIGAGLSNSRLFRAAIYPNLVFFQLIPKVALAPLFIIWLG